MILGNGPAQIGSGECPMAMAHLLRVGRIVPHKRRAEIITRCVMVCEKTRPRSGLRAVARHKGSVSMLAGLRGDGVVSEHDATLATNVGGSGARRSAVGDEPFKLFYGGDYLELVTAELDGVGLWDRWNFTGRAAEIDGEWSSVKGAQFSNIVAQVDGHLSSSNKG